MDRDKQNRVNFNLVNSNHRKSFSHSITFIIYSENKTRFKKFKILKMDSNFSAENQNFYLYNLFKL
jgi:hypothetical protein